MRKAVGTIGIKSPFHPFWPLTGMYQGLLNLENRSAYQDTKDDVLVLYNGMKRGGEEASKYVLL